MNEGKHAHFMMPFIRLGIPACLSGASLLWAYWPTLGEMERVWSRDPRYSHGYLVPAFAIYLLWLRRHQRPNCVAWNGMGLLFIAAAAALRLLGAHYYITWIDAFSLLPSLAALCLLMGGWASLCWAWPAIAFLIFMIPLPYHAEVILGSPLQRLATQSSTYTLQLCGLPAFSSGNTIAIGDYTIGIVDACNGLGASYTVLACAFGAVAIFKRPALDKIILIISAIPVALLANTTRITLTGLFHELVGSAAAESYSHDLAGWLTLPLSLAVLYMESRLVSRLFIEPNDPTALRVEPNAIRSRSVEKALPEIKRSHLFAAVIAICIIVATGTVHGFKFDRWGVSRELEAARSRVDRVPMTIGSWKGGPSNFDRRAMLAVGLEGFISRGYKNDATGKSVSLLLMCGRPGPVSVHTPEICYPGAGFELIQTHPSEVRVGAEPVGEFPQSRL